MKKFLKLSLISLLSSSIFTIVIISGIYSIADLDHEKKHPIGEVFSEEN
jgi:hypothetical protein